jgi:hypothetical protein
VGILLNAQGGLVFGTLLLVIGCLVMFLSATYVLENMARTRGILMARGQGLPENYIGYIKYVPGTNNCHRQMLRSFKNCSGGIRRILLRLPTYLSFCFMYLCIWPLSSVDCHACKRSPQSRLVH